MNESPRDEQAIFQAALNLSPKERAAYLDRACGGDARLRERINRALFEADAHTPPQPQTPAADASTITIDAPPAPDFLGEQLGDRIGRYKLLEQIGEGGTGGIKFCRAEPPKPN